MCAAALAAIESAVQSARSRDARSLELRCRLNSRKRRTLTTFRELGVLPEICDALERAGITTPFAIQEMTLSVALMGTDLIGQARTGTGKTLAFGIPVLQRSVTMTDPAYADLPQGKPQALIVAPTRELALQVSNDLHLASKDLGLRVLTVYGGVGYDTQLDTLAVRRRHRRRHPRSPDRPGQPPRAGPLPRARAGARRGRRDARPRLPARRPAAPVDDARDPPDDAVLGHDAGRDRLAGPHPHAPPDEHPRRVVVRHHDGARDRAVHLPGPRPRQARDHRPRPAGRGRRQDHRLHPHQASVAAGRRRPVRARLHRQPPARRHGAGGPREGARRSSARTRSGSWSPPTSPPAASTSPASPTSSTTPAPRTTRPTSTGSAAPAAPAPPAPRSPSSTGRTCTAGR